MFDRFFSKGREKQSVTAAREAVEKSRAAVESVIGLPHVLSHEILQRRFGERMQPSSDEFAKTGASGSWTFPPIHPDIVARIKADETGRLVLGVILGRAEFEGLTVYTEWDRFKPVSEWRIEISSEPGALAQELYQRLLSH